MSKQISTTVLLDEVTLKDKGREIMEKPEKKYDNEKNYPRLQGFNTACDEWEAYHAQVLEKDYIRKDSVKWMGEEGLLKELINQAHNEGNGECTIPTWFYNDIKNALSSLAIPEMKRPKIICICGSSRFCEEISVKAWEYAKEGIIAFGLYLLPDWYMSVKHHGAEHEGVAEILDQLHFQKIEMADEVFIFNKDGYIGNQTRKEIEHAKKNNKPIIYLEPLT